MGSTCLKHSRVHPHSLKQQAAALAHTLALMCTQIPLPQYHWLLKEGVAFCWGFLGAGGVLGMSQMVGEAIPRHRWGQ